MKAFTSKEKKLWELAESYNTTGYDWFDIVDQYICGELPEFIKSNSHPEELIATLAIVEQFVDTPKDKRGTPEVFTHNYKLALPKYDFQDMSDLFLEMDGSEPSWVNSLYAIWTYKPDMGVTEYGAFAPDDACQLIEWYIHERNYHQPHQTRLEAWAKNLLGFVKPTTSPEAAENRNDMDSILDIDRLLEELEIDKPIPRSLNAYRSFFFELNLRPSDTTLYPGGLNAQTKKIQRKLKRTPATTRKSWWESRYGGSQILW